MEIKKFVLHEDTGEPDANKKTDDLHAFLHELCGPETKNDAEGSHSGLLIYLNADPGDTIEMMDGGWVRIVPRPTDPIEAEGPTAATRDPDGVET
jgi:hypothetical protein